MFGSNMGYIPGLRQSISRKYAWLPVKTSNHKWIWFDHYYKILMYHEMNSNDDTEKLMWYKILSKNEYLLWLINNPPKQPKPPSSGSAVVR